MNAHHDPNRQQRRAAARKASRACPVRPTFAPPHPLLALGADEAARVAETFSAHMLGLSPETRLDMSVFVFDGAGPCETSIWAMAAIVAPIVAQRHLEACGFHARLVAGAALWSVGPGALDTLDHGVGVGSMPAAQAVAMTAYHLWLETDDALVDVATRYLPFKLERAHAQQPFTTPPEAWRRFPPTLVHDRRQPMPDPRRDASAPYGYWPRGEGFLDLVLADVARRGPEFASLIER